LPLLGLGVALAAGIGGTVAFLRRRMPSPAAYLELGDGRRIPLSSQLAVGRKLFPDSDPSVKEEHAEIYQQEGHWMIALKAGEAMWVDGRRSRKNRLRNGATVKLSPHGDSFAFVAAMEQARGKDTRSAPASEVGK
jgi:uncharacterized membrane protein